MKRYVGPSVVSQMLNYVPTALPRSTTLVRGPGRAPGRPYILRYVAAGTKESEDPQLAREYVEQQVPIAASWSKALLLGIALVVSGIVAGQGVTTDTHHAAYALIGSALALVGVALIASAGFAPVGPDQTSLAASIVRIRNSQLLSGQITESTARQETDIARALWMLAQGDPWVVQLRNAGDLAMLGGSLVALVAVVCVALPLRPSAASGSIAAAAIGVLGLLAGACTGLRRGHDGRKEAIEGQRRHADVAQVFAAYVPPDRAVTAIRLIGEAVT